MADRTNARPKYKIVFRPGKTSTKVALLAVIVLSTVTLIAIGCAIRNGRARAEALRAQAFAEEQERQALREDIDALGSDDSVRDIAGEKLDPPLVDPDQIVYVQETTESEK